MHDVEGESLAAMGAGDLPPQHAPQAQAHQDRKRFFFRDLSNRSRDGSGTTIDDGSQHKVSHLTCQLRSNVRRAAIGSVIHRRLSRNPLCCIDIDMTIGFEISEEKGDSDDVTRPGRHGR